MPDPFLKALEDLLEDQLDSLPIEKIDPAYCIYQNRRDEIYHTLKTLPEKMETAKGIINVHEHLIELVDLTGILAGSHFDAGVKHGFSLAFKLIIHNLNQ